MGKQILLLDYAKQIDNLSITIEQHHNNARNIAVSVLDNKKIIINAKKQLNLLQNISEDNAKSIENLKSIMDKLQSDQTIDDTDIQKLSIPSTLLIENEYLLEDSLASKGNLLEPEYLLEELLPQNELYKLKQYLSRPLYKRFKWSKADYLIVAIAVIIGLSVDLFNISWKATSPIDKDGLIKNWFNSKLHHHESNNPIDYQGAGFGGGLHRVRTEGHDLIRFFDAINQTATGEFHGIIWQDKTPIEIISKFNQSGAAYPEMGWFSAFVNLSTHLFADLFSANSLPLPLSSVVYENCSSEMRVFVHDMYKNGYNLRHISLNLIEIWLAYLAIEIWLWLQYGNENIKEPAISLKRYEMRTATMSMLSGFNIGGCLLFQTPFFINIPVLFTAIDSSVKLLNSEINRNSIIAIEQRNITEIFESWNRLNEKFNSSC